MREFPIAVVNCFSALKAQLCAAVSIPLSDVSEIEEFETARGDGKILPDHIPSECKALNCVEEHPGYLTRNGLGSLEIGAAVDD